MGRELMSVIDVLSWCTTCDHGYMSGEWDFDADMCKECASCLN